MATYNYFELKQGMYPSIKPGSNWFHIRFDGKVFEEYFQAIGASGDIFRLMEVKNHWIIKNGFTRVSSPAVATATGDLEISVANELDNAFALQGGADTWIRTDGTDDAAPLAVIADGYVLLTVNTEALLTTTVFDIMLEVIVSPWDIE
ncbi:MAG: hypothetical protein ACERKJ_07875 [Candidatus Dadabacteria bacterium]